MKGLRLGSSGTRVLLVDAFNLIRRIFEARPDPESHIDEVIQASSNSLARALRDHAPTHACAVFDSHDRTWRHLLYADYKGTRKPTPQVLLDNLHGFRDAFLERGVRSLKLDNYEADDQLATLAKGIEKTGGEAFILSTDRMFQQQLSTNIRIFNHFEGHEVTREEVEERFGVRVDQLIDFWAMAGDSSNNIKGVPRVGKKTAASLLEHYGSLDAVIASSDDDAAVRRVQDASEAALRCRQLVTLKTDVELGINLRSLRLEK
jgi:protein Xni